MTTDSPSTALSTSHRDVLQLVAEFRDQGQSVPPAGMLAILLGLGMGPRMRDAVWQALRSLESEGYIISVPRTPRGRSYHRIRMLAAGYTALGMAPPKHVTVVRQVRVTPISWRCAVCDAVTLETNKRCAMCRILERATMDPVFFQPTEGAA